MGSLGFLVCLVEKEIEDLQGIRILTQVLRETLVSEVNQGLWADLDLMVTLGQWDMGLLGFQEVREMLEYLACQDSLEFQARKVNQATFTSQDLLDLLDLKVNGAYLVAQALKEFQVLQDFQVVQDRKEK